MYAGQHATTRSGQAALVMADSGEIVTHGELEARGNRLAHFLRSAGLQRLDHYAIFMENNVRYVETCAAGERAGLYYTCVNSFLIPDELAYILRNSESKVLITSVAKRDVALAAMRQSPNVALCLVVDGPGDGAAVRNLDEATAERVFDEFVQLVRGQGSAALIATHNERLAFRMDRVLRLHEGVLE